MTKKRHVQLSTVKENGNPEPPSISCSPKQSFGDRFEGQFGFRIEDFSSVTSFVKLLNRPMDPACLGVMRFMYGLLMFCDTIQERGLSGADILYGDRYECHFPLFTFLRPLPVQWMIVMYALMALGALGMMLGLLFRLSSVMFVVPYWYLFFLDKTTWNNHSYLFGLTGFMLLISDANRYWSLDGLIWPAKRNAHVPLWNYTLLRTQFFFVYFLAGLKKLDADWMTGYSMSRLSVHWVFSPFKLLLTTDQIDLYIVHMGGLLLDLTIGYFLFFDLTRPYAFFFGGSFHLMNSQLFSIGMFPWTMLATMPLFSYSHWPRQLLHKCPPQLHSILPLREPPQPSSHCIYKKEDIKSEETNPSSTDLQNSTAPLIRKMHSQPGHYHKTFTAVTVLYLSTQLFLPYSHFITKGYNNWTNGLYGYSWDMMVHTWSLQHIKISYVRKDTGHVGYLKPLAWTRGKSRWSSHADMIKQYAYCIEERLQEFNVTNLELYFDVWRSMNKRFQQRMFDPRVDMLRAEWHPLKATPWLMPLLLDLSSWREELRDITRMLRNQTEAADTVFVADFPGLNLENYIQEHLNASVKVLKGQVIVELVNETSPEHSQRFNLSQGDQMQLPANAFHTVHTVSEEPSCYMYIYINTTHLDYVKNLSIYEQKLLETAPKDSDGKVNMTKVLQNRVDDTPDVLDYKDSLRKKIIRQAIEGKPWWWSFLDFWVKKAGVIKRSYSVIYCGFVSLFTNQTVAEVMRARNNQTLEQPLTNISMEQPQPDDPSTEQPQPDDPSTEQPQPDDPSTEQPQPDDPSTEQPQLDDPSKAQPQPDDPSKGQPQLDDPSKAQPQPDDPSKGQPQLDDPSMRQSQLDDPSKAQPQPDDPSKGQPDHLGQQPADLSAGQLPDPTEQPDDTSVGQYQADDSRQQPDDNSTGQQPPDGLSKRQEQADIPSTGQQGSEDPSKGQDEPDDAATGQPRTAERSAEQQQRAERPAGQ